MDIIFKLCERAFSLLEKGDKEGYNEIVKKAVRELEKEVDVIALAQGSMAVLLPGLKDINCPILTSPRSGVFKSK